MSAARVIHLAPRTKVELTLYTRPKCLPANCIARTWLEVGQPNCLAIADEYRAMYEAMGFHVLSIELDAPGGLKWSASK